MRRSRNPFDGDVWGDVHGANRSSDLVSGNVVASRFDVQSDSRGTLVHALAERAFEVASVMGEGVLMLRKGPESEMVGAA